MIPNKKKLPWVSHSFLTTDLTLWLLSWLICYLVSGTRSQPLAIFSSLWYTILLVNLLWIKVFKMTNKRPHMMSEMPTKFPTSWHSWHRFWREVMSDIHSWDMRNSCPPCWRIREKEQIYVNKYTWRPSSHFPYKW